GRETARLEQQVEPVDMRLLRWLGTHRAELVTLLGHQERVVPGPRPDQTIRSACNGVYENHVANERFGIEADLEQALCPAPEAPSRSRLHPAALPRMRRATFA